MGPVSDNHEPRGKGHKGRKSLVDAAGDPSRPDDLALQTKPRRKRLSDIQAETDEPQLESKSQHPTLTNAVQNQSGEPQSPPASPARGLMELDTSGQKEPQSRSGRPHLKDLAVTPDEGESQPKPARPMLADAERQTAARKIQSKLQRPCLGEERPISAGAEEIGQIQFQAGGTERRQLSAELRAKQNLSLAAVGGLAAASAGAVLWAVVAVATDYPTGWMAIGVGLLVACVVRLLGRGLDKSFGYLGAALTVLGCLLGNALTVCLIVAAQERLSLGVVLMPMAIPKGMLAMFYPIDPLFYATAIYVGLRFSVRRLPADEVGGLTRRN
jgi:hypothetical protein